MKIKILHPEAKVPTISYKSAAYDFYCLDGCHLYPNCGHKFKTGIAIQLPKNHVGLFRDRSSIGSKLVIVGAGVIDDDFRGEIEICLINVGTITREIKAGDKIAQLLVFETNRDPVEVVEELDETERGSRGFGSTG